MHPGPTVCTAKNKGCCNCGPRDGNRVTTYVWWHADNAGNQLQRCLQTYGIPSPSGAASSVPVVIISAGYDAGPPDFDPDATDAADRYGFALFSLSPAIRNGSRLGDGGAVGGFGLEFGAQGVVNDTSPTPCTVADSRDIPYIGGALDLVATTPTLDSGKVFVKGFSQESMFAAYTAVCFADRIRGVWQGGSGMVRNSHTPIVPGFEGNCARQDFLQHGTDCCAQNFCAGCKYFPIYPKTCGNKIVDCLMTYEGDGIACGADANMYNAMVAEGNEARLVLFPAGGHDVPRPLWSWSVGCLGVVDACSSGCEAAFSGCVGATVDATKFRACERQLHAGNLAGCAAGCAPTLGMLSLSQVPAKVELSEGAFGTTTGLSTNQLPNLRVNATTVAHTTCTAPYGPFGAGGVGDCARPSTATSPDFTVGPTDSICPSSPASEPTPTPTADPSRLPTAAGCTTSCSRGGRGYRRQ